MSLHTSFLPVHRIYVSDSCMSIGHWVFWPPHPSEPPHIRFLFVEHAFCYRLPPDLMLPLRPCRVANSSPHRASSGFAPYRSAPCWAHYRNRVCLQTANPVSELKVFSLFSTQSKLFHRTNCLSFSEKTTATRINFFPERSASP